MSGAIEFLGSERAKRTRLADCVPLKKPFTIRVSPGRVCDLRCEFCYHSVPEDRERLARISGSRLMDLSLFQKLMDDICASFGTIRKLSLVGRGEPLLNPQIAEMVAYASKRQAAEQIDIVTNGVSLTEDLSERLIDAGLSALRVSVNGLSAEDYLRRCGVKIDFERYLRQLRYFYDHRKHTTLYIKTINYLVDTPELRERFYRMFQPICDIINIESLYETEADIDFQTLTKEPEKLNCSKDTLEQVQTKFCSSPFYTLQIDENGVVQPCCAKVFYDETSALGNIADTSLKEIWFERSRPFQRRILDGLDGIFFCEGCTVRLSQTYPEDILDDSVERLKALYDQAAPRGKMEAEHDE